MIGTLFWIAVGAAGMYFLDPERGARRRNVARDRLMATARDAQREAEQRAKYVASTAEGLARKAEHEISAVKSAATTTLDDYTLAQKVESELFRDPSFDKGKINVNAENGVVVLRGEVQRPEEINSIEAQVRRIEGVHNVDNKLHLPNTPPPGGSTYSYTG
jgi:osmotically-inducible protein OsmY